MITKKELESVKSKIIENPENLQMSGWHCGTAHCIGGWLETLYPNKYRISNKFIDGGQLTRNNFPDTLETSNNEDRNCSLFAVYTWDSFMRKDQIYKIYNMLRIPIKKEFDNLKPELKQKFAIIAIDSYIKKYNIN